MEVNHTSRGFEVIRFKDRNGQECTLQQSSIADFEPPGSSAIWFGVGENRMHLSLAQVKELLPHLQRWADSGSFEGEVADESCIHCGAGLAPESNVYHCEKSPSGKHETRYMARLRAEIAKL